MYKKSPERAERAENAECWVRGYLVILERLVPHDRQTVPCSMLPAAGEVRIEAYFSVSS